MSSSLPAAGPAPVTCSCCAATATVLLGWTVDVTPRGPQYLCGRCSRDNLRDIEARLDVLP